MSDAHAQPASAQPTSRVDLGPVTLSAAPGRSFYPLSDRVIGRPADGVGGIQIVRLASASVGWPATHETCMSAAVTASEQNVEGPGFDRAETGDCCQAGGESFRSAGDFVRIWYRHCPDGMVAAWFACKEDRMADRNVVESIRQADRMIATVRVPPPVA